MPDKARKFIFFTVFMKCGHIYFSSLIILLFCCKKQMRHHPFKIQSPFHLNLPKQTCLNIKSLFHIYITARVWGCHSQNFDNHKFNVFTIKFTRLIMKIFKCVAIAFDCIWRIVTNRWRHKGNSISCIWKRCRPALRTFTAWTMTEI